MLAVLEAVQRGEVAPADALARLGELPFRDLGFARVDTHRELRQGAPEAILAEGKAPEEIEAIARAMLEERRGQRAGDARRRGRARRRCARSRRTPRRTSARGSPGWRATCRRRAGWSRSSPAGRRTGRS